MAYEKTIWKNREVERPRTFKKVENPDGTITLVPAEGNIIEPGTPIIAKNMNNIEQGIVDAHTKAEQAFQSASDGKHKIAGAITGKGVPTDPSDTFATMANNINAIETDKTGDATAVAADILSGKTAYAKGSKLTGTIPARTAVNKTLTNQGDQINIPSGYFKEPGIIKVNFANLHASNIKKGINVGGIVGTLVQGIQGESSGVYASINVASFGWWDGENVDSVRRYKKVLKTNVISGKCKVYFQATGNTSSRPETYPCRCSVYKNNNLIGSTTIYVRDVDYDEEKETTYGSVEINLSGSKDDRYEFRMDAEDHPTKAGIELGFKTTGVEIYN